MFKKLKASLGIGAAKVDTVLEQDSIFQGDYLRGAIHIQGGDVEQQIDAIKLKLCTEVKEEINDNAVYRNFILQRLQVVKPFTINPNERREIPFKFRLHDETPITALHVRNNKCKVWLETSLDIDMALDPKDRDFIEIKPLPAISKIIDALQQSGFVMAKADVESGFLKADHFASKSGCYQEIELKYGSFLNAKEVELSFIVDGDIIHCLAEIDRSFDMRGDMYRSFSLNRDASDADIRTAIQPLLTL